MAADTAAATNNQPGMVLAELGHSNNVRPPPSGGTKIGTTVSHTWATSTIPLRAKRAENLGRRTTGTRPAPTWRAGWWQGCTSPSCPWRPAVLHRQPPVALSNSKLPTLPSTVHPATCQRKAQHPHRVLHWHATNRGCIPSAQDHGLPHPSTRPSNQLCRAVSARDRYHTDDATAHLTGKPEDDPLHCSQPTALPTPVPSQPAATGILLLTSRGG